MDTPTEWYKGLPLFTKMIITSCFFVTLLFFLGLLDPYWMYLDLELIFGKLQFSFQWVFSIYFLCNFSTRLERNEMFHRTPGDYLIFLLFQMLVIDLVAQLLPFPSPFLGSALSFSIIYYWSKREPFARMSYWGFAIQASQFPFALLFLSFIMGNSIWFDVLGLLSGHLFYFLREVVPAEFHWTVIRTPVFVHKGIAWLQDKIGPAGAGAQAHEAARDAQRVNQAGGNFFAGRGHRLG